MPRPVEALPWGSESISNTRSPTAARAVPRLMAVVVLPTPPFWLATANTRIGATGKTGSDLSDTGQSLHFNDTAARIAAADFETTLELPGFSGFLKLGYHILRLQKQTPGPALEVGPCVPEQSCHRRAGLRADDTTARVR